MAGKKWPSKKNIINNILKKVKKPKKIKKPKKEDEDGLLDAKTILSNIANNVENLFGPHINISGIALHFITLTYDEDPEISFKLSNDLTNINLSTEDPAGLDSPWSFQLADPKVFEKVMLKMKETYERSNMLTTVEYYVPYASTPDLKKIYKITKKYEEQDEKEEDIEDLVPF